jgi:hypothetical protein
MSDKHAPKKNNASNQDKFTCRLEIPFSDTRLGDFARLAKQGAIVDEEGLISLKGKDLVEYALMVFAAKYARKGAKSDGAFGSKESTLERSTNSDAPKGLGGLNLGSFLQSSK